MLTIVSFLVYTVMVGLVVLWFTKREQVQSSEGFFLAGRSLGAWVIAGSLMLTNLSTEHLIGLNADAYRHTIAVMAWETTSAIAMVALALYFLPRYLGFGLTTIPEFLEKRFDATTRLLTSLLFLVSYAVAILPVVLLFGAAGLESLFDVSETWGLSPDASKWILIWGVGILGSLYAILGGLRAVAISDTVNGIGFLIASLLIPLLALRSIGNGNAWDGFQEVYTSHPEKFDITGDEPGSFLPFGVLFTGMVVNQIFFWCTNQSIVQRALAARSLASGQQGVLIAATLKLLGPLVIVLPGVIAYHLFFDELGYDGAMLAYPTLVKHTLPPVLTGLFAAVMVGAILSTFNSVLNSSATLFSRGVYAPLVAHQPTDKEMVRVGRLSSLALAVAAMTMAPLINTEGSLYEYLQRINATFFGPMLAVILAGLLTQWATPLAAKLALLLGPVIYYVLVFAANEPVQAVLRSTLGTTEDVHFLHFLGAVFVITCGIIVVTSWFFPGERRALTPTQQFVDMTPWRWAVPSGALIVVLTIACYWWLAR